MTHSSAARVCQRTSNEKNKKTPACRRQECGSNVRLTKVASGTFLCWHTPWHVSTSARQQEVRHMYIFTHIYTCMHEFTHIFICTHVLSLYPSHIHMTVPSGTKSERKLKSRESIQSTRIFSLQLLLQICRALHAALQNRNPPETSNPKQRFHEDRGTRH